MYPVMQIAKSHQMKGFTIVELLVVIVVIGVLAAISLVSYSAISGKAVTASLRSDLTNASRQLKLYGVVYGEYPSTLDDSNCPSAPTPDSKYCFKLSGDNVRDSYVRPTPQTFTLVIKNGNSRYQITENSTPEIPLVFLAGGTITKLSGVRMHMFSSGVTTITAAADGTVDVVIIGAGGGGGGGSRDMGGGAFAGSPGGSSSVLHVAPNATYVAVGGSGGGGGYDDGDTSYPGVSGASGGSQVQGTASLSGWVTVSGGGSTGGAGGLGQFDGAGGSGGAGGKLSGRITLTAGQQLTITVGSGGNGGIGSQANGSVGSTGSVSISYPY